MRLAAALWQYRGRPAGGGTLQFVLEYHYIRTESANAMTEQFCYLHYLAMSNNRWYSISLQ